MPVSLIIELIAQGASKEEMCEEYPDIEEEDIRQSLEYTVWLTRDEVI